MAKYDPAIHHRRSIRLKNYDYSQVGAYFITICTHDQRCVFGTILNGEMQSNPLGSVGIEQWQALSVRFPSVRFMNMS